ncbi:ABC transporter [Subtercola sp. Z020]|uniref:ABC transporter ATP-binding protein n=1 Tax=Subtercola sp. Z020 TaxID=2080582 RepID=UPI000CE7F96D|nr:ATP-binding cassette domain-containing protein [Subtercola sp. Z020]PPF86978.1 ABC transporter [Subtercola sp. Z020]
MTPPAGAPRLEARDLTFAYSHSSEPLLDGWSDDFHPGEIVALTGASGRGKSTLLYLLGLMVRPTSGSLLVDSVPMDALADAERAGIRAARIGFVFQDALLDASRTVLDNVLEPCLYRSEPRRPAEHRALALLARFGVEHRSASRPGQISGGQAQRIALCRALLNSPGIVLADEPTGNLDAASAAVVLAAFREAADGGATVVIATHDADLVARCDRRREL